MEIVSAPLGSQANPSGLSKNCAAARRVFAKFGVLTLLMLEVSALWGATPIPLTDDEVQRAIDRAHSAPFLPVCQTKVLFFPDAPRRGCWRPNDEEVGVSAMEGYFKMNVIVWTPAEWIEYQAVLIRRLGGMFSLANVTDEMRAPVLRVSAEVTPGNPTVGVSAIEICDKSKQTVIQPIAFSQPLAFSADAKFRLEDVKTVSAKNTKGEMFIVVENNGGITSALPWSKPKKSTRDYVKFTMAFH